ncbi:MAG: PKD domain-containing protein [Saprospiraceae bacterium]|nr:PKD domain-containing protein [Saprospiraceae bacterium]
MKTFSDRKSNRFSAFVQNIRHAAGLILLSGLFSTASMAQGGGCGEISFTLVNYDPCLYRVVADNNSECFPFLRVLIGGTEFVDWQANTAGGWTGELVNPSEILLTHSSGKVPFGTSLPLEFSFPPDIIPQLTILWDYACPLEEGCAFETTLDACTFPADATITGTVYADIGCAELPFTNQPGLAGWTIELSDDQGNLIASASTDTAGNYAFYDLMPGIYLVKAFLLPGWTSSVPASGEYLIDLGTSEDEVLNFGMCWLDCTCNIVQTTVNMISSDPAKCCYNLSVQSGNYCFQYIFVQVDAGQTITSWNIIPGYTATLINPQFLQLIPNSGVVAQGTTFLGAFCVTGSANHDILVITGFTDSGGSYECDKLTSFDCPYCACPPPTDLKITNVEPTSALLTFVPADCAQTTWIIVEDVNGNSTDHVVFPMETSVLLDSLMPDTDYRVYAFSNCGDLMSGNSDTIYINRYYDPCPGSLVVNGDFEGYSALPTGPGQISFATGWQSSNNNTNSLSDWYSFDGYFSGNPVFLSSYYDASGSQYNLLNAFTWRSYAGFELNSCEGITTQLTSSIQQFYGYTISFWWTPKETITQNDVFAVHLSNQPLNFVYNQNQCFATGSGGGLSYTSVQVPITPAHQPGTWYEFVHTSNTPITFNWIAIAPNTLTATDNYIHVDAVCVRSLFLPCDTGKPRITHNPEQPGAFLGEVDLGPGSTIVSAVWDFGDGNTDSSDVVSSVIHDYAAPGTYEVCLTVTAMDTSGATCSNSTCITVDVTPLSDPCDDVAAFLLYNGGCCYQLIINNSDPTTFTQLDVTLSSGDFVNSQLQGTWNTTVNGNMASFLPTPGPFIPAGQDVPVILCDLNGNDPYTVDVDFLHNGGVCHQTLNLSCDPNQCTCQGFQDLEFYNFLGLPDMPVICDDPVSIQLPCIGSDAVYSLQGNFLCQGVCTPSVTYEIYQVNGPLVLSGSALPLGFKFGPGDYRLELNGFCGPDTCKCTILFTIPDCGGTCVCAANSFAVAAQLPGSVQPIACGQTVPVDPGEVFSILTSFHCQGTACNPTDQVSWSFTGPGGLSLGSSATASPNFSVPPVTQMAYSTPGTYTLDMYGICGLQDTCRCTVFIEVKDTCCDDQVAFNAAAAAVNTFGTLGNCTLSFQATGLDSCMQIKYGWGDNTSSGPFGNDQLVTHHYAAAGTYWVCDTIEEVNAQGMVCWKAVRCDSVLVLCDTCLCGGFTGLTARPDSGAQSILLTCGGPPVQMGCPNEGFPIPFTGVFDCVGTTCSPVTQVNWTLTGPSGTFTGSVLASPYFYIPILPVQYGLPGLYTLTLNGACNVQMCATCVVQFNVNCPDPCPCNSTTFQQTVAQGFATALWNSSCKGCFSPVALDACDEVSWSVNNGPVLFNTYGTQSFCHTFSGAGPHTVTMTVVRKKGDGTVCDQATFTKSIPLSCAKAADCTGSVVDNTGFNDGAVSGGLASGGETSGWKALWGDPHVKEVAGSSDAWSIELSGKLDTSDVLSTESAFCLEKDTGTIRMRVARVLAVGPDTLSDVNFGCKLSVQLFRGDNYEYSYPNWNPIRCLSTLSLDITSLDSGWVDINVPYDISGWNVSDDSICGNGSQAVYLRPVIYVTNALGMEQGGDDTRTRVRVDYFCLDGTLTATHEPGNPMNLRVFPNPTTGQVTVSWDQPLPADARLVFTDVVGKEVYTTRPEGLNTSVTAELGPLPPGMYFLNVRSVERLFETVKLIKQ